MTNLITTKKYICLKHQKYFLDEYCLAVIQRKDIEKIRKWRNKQLNVLRQLNPISTKQQVEYFSNNIWPSMKESQPKNILFTFFWKEKQIGYGGLVHISWHNKNAELSFLLSPKYMLRDDIYEKHFNKYIRMLLNIAFKDLNLHRISTETYSFRKKTINILEKNSFKLEGIERDQTLINGKFYNSFIHGILNQKLLDQPSLNNNVLITSISDKIPLIKAVKESLNKFSEIPAEIVGSDSNKSCIGEYFVDKFWKMPKLTKLKIENLIEYCHKNNIKFIIPTRDGELLFFANHKKTLKENGINVMISKTKSIETCRDKLSFYKFGKNNNLPIIKAEKKIDNIKAKRFVVKERFGAGAKNIGLNLTKNEAFKWAKNMESPIFQPFVTGKEASVDVYINKYNKAVEIVSRWREVIVNGESKVTSTFHSKKINTTISKFVKKADLYGHVIIQVLVKKNGEIKIIECNPRFGGASTLGLAAGLDSFYWFMMESTGQDISNLKLPFKNLTQIRHKSDLIISK